MLCWKRTISNGCLLTDTGFGVHLFILFSFTAGFYENKHKQKNKVLTSHAIKGYNVLYVSPETNSGWSPFELAGWRRGEGGREVLKYWILFLFTYWAYSTTTQYRKYRDIYINFYIQVKYKRCNFSVYLIKNSAWRNYRVCNLNQKYLLKQHKLHTSMSTYSCLWLGSRHRIIE